MARGKAAAVMSNVANAKSARIASETLAYWLPSNVPGCHSAALVRSVPGVSTSARYTRFAARTIAPD
ncbi:hypothetical protein [Lysobacter gummosus]|uniref:hypothetical protein n=1 Tax=Lysobacter gummosus TaxID=262324 RepID=UPI0036377677